MAIELRDLEADRRLLSPIPFSDFDGALQLALEAALDEIERLKWMLVKKGPYGQWYGSWHGCMTENYKTEADAWAAVRKAAMK